MTQVDGVGSATATVLFTDVVGSTEMRVRLGEDDADELRRLHDRLVAQAVEVNGGRVVKGLGDGIMAVFGSASDALAAAVAAQQALARHNRSSTSASRLDVRMGLAVGDVALEDGDCFGTPLVEASRLCAAARGGQILASELVQAVAGARRGHVFKPVGTLELKGLRTPVATVEVGWEADRAHRVHLPPGLDHAPSLPFVGREREWDRLCRSWDEAEAGARPIVLVSGEPGIGKTRLVSELARSVHKRGAIVLYGRCQEELGVPYHGFAEALRTFVAVCPVDDLRMHLGPLARELVRLVPSLPDRVPDLPAPLPAEPETERYRLFEAVAELLRGMSHVAPVLLVLDDLHWATGPDVALLRHLVGPTRLERVLVVGTYRDTEVDESHPLAPVLAYLRREPGVERLSLAGLEEAAVAELLEASVGQSATASARALSRALHAETDGNPFFVSEVLRHLAESGAAAEHAVDAGAQALLTELVLPEGVRELVSRRLARLPEAAREVLGVAAVIGRQFDVSVLVATSPAEPDTVFDALERAEQARLVAAVGRRLDLYAFSHSLVRATLYEGLPAIRRARLHRSVGEALERRRRDDELPDLARHFNEAGPAGDAARAVDYAWRAGQQAGGRLAHEQAAACYSLALDALSWGPRATDVSARDVLLARAEAWRRAGETHHARDDFLAAAEAARKENDPEALARAALGLGEVSAVWGADPVLVDILQSALDALSADQRGLRACLLARLGQALYYSGATPRLELSRRAIEEARQAGDPRALASVLRAHHVALSGADGLAERKEVADQIVRLAEEAGDPELALHGHGWRFVDLLELGDREGADRDLAAHAELAQSLRQPLHLRDAAWWRATVATLEGRFAEAEVAIDEARVLGQQANDPYVDGAWWVQRGWLLFDAERLDELREVLAVTRGFVESYPEVPAWVAARALLAAVLGEHEEARADVNQVVTAHLAEMPRDATWLVCIVLLASACSELDDPAHADTLYELLAPYAWRVMVPDRAWACRGAISYYLGQLAALTGRWEDAAVHFQDAVGLQRRLRARPLLARTRYHHARVLLTRGKPDDVARAEDLASQALGAAERLGMRKLIGDALAVLDRAAGRY